MNAPALSRDLLVAPPELVAATSGLGSEEAKKRLVAFGRNRLQPELRLDSLRILLAQFKSPIILILVGAALVSLFVEDHTDAILILAVVLISGLLGFWQEYGASCAIQKLRALVETKVRVLRDGHEIFIPIEEVVPGDVVILSAGAIIPGDSRLIESRELFVNEAVLTGETFPAEKDTVDGGSGSKDALFMGTHVVSGWGKAVILSTGTKTRFGQIASSLRLRRPETDFEHGVRHFGYLLAEITLLLVLAIFAFNVFLHKPVLDSFLFAIALAVGLTPQLLPAIITINLSHGARRMAREKVIVKRLAAIENFGSMTVLCSDKTGTITEGQIDVRGTIDPRGSESEKVRLYAYLNAANETGFVNPIDQAIRAQRMPDCAGWTKLDELPYDFVRKRLSILFEKENRNVLIAKGALQQILSICNEAELVDGSRCEINALHDQIYREWQNFSLQGCRVLGLAYREFGPQVLHITRESECEMIFLGFIVLSDSAKPGIEKILEELRELGVRVKIITGDNVLVAGHLAEQVGLDGARVLSGREIQEMTDGALMQQAVEVDVFAEIEPSQKARLVLALKRAGQVVGYIGDGINDVSALHAADVSLSVEGAVDVAREAADFVLLERNLEVLIDGIREGRRTFANTLKYVFIATSANFGNMFSMAGASLFLPFLPLLPKQILLINLLTDLPEMTIATDSVDREQTERPCRWDVHVIRRFMTVFGLISSIFDYLTFGVLIWLNATIEQFRTGWLIESVVSAALIVLVIRTRHPFFQSRPSKLLVLATAGVVVFTAILPLLPIASVVGLQVMPGPFYLVIGAIVVAYVVIAEVAKHFFYSFARTR